MCIMFFFFKQKTAYEMRISDWSSDVCSSDLLFERGTFGRHGTEHKAAVTRYARYFSKADTGFRNAFVAIGQRIAHQVAGIRESPGMVGADKRFAKIGRAHV